MKYSEFVCIRRDALSSVIAESMTMITDCAQGAGIISEISSRIFHYSYIGAVVIGCGEGDVIAGGINIAVLGGVKHWLRGQRYSRSKIWSKCRGESWRRGGGSSWSLIRRKRHRFGRDKNWRFGRSLSWRWIWSKRWNVSWGCSRMQYWDMHLGSEYRCKCRI